MSDNLSTSTAFDVLLQEFCADVGLTLDGRKEGIEFEADQHVVLITTDPRQSDRILIDVTVQVLEALDPRLMIALHQLNDSARLQHDWVISIGVDDRLRIHTQKDLASCRPSDLQTVFTEGIERAQALQTLFETFEQAGESGSPIAASAVSDFALYLNRG